MNDERPSCGYCDMETGMFVLIDPMLDCSDPVFVDMEKPIVHQATAILTPGIPLFGEP